MPIPGPHFMNEGVLRDLWIKAGFNEGKVQVHHDETIRKDEDHKGMRDFMLGDISKMATKDWTNEDKGRWSAAADEATGRDVNDMEGFISKRGQPLHTSRIRMSRIGPFSEIKLHDWMSYESECGLHS